MAAAGYGIVHDEITAHLCVEYFTVAHPPLFHTTSPFLLGICWGIAATIGLGLVFGCLLAAVSLGGEAPASAQGTLVRRVGLLLGAMAVSALLAGLAGFALSRFSLVRLPALLGSVIPFARHDRFFAVWFAHLASYAVGLGGSAWLIFQVWCERGRPRVLTLWPRTPGGVVRVIALLAIVLLVIWWRRGG
ncbi:MAG TPA: hypothetical protein VGL24_11585 [Chthoniobacterales bacterium]